MTDLLNIPVTLNQGTESSLADIAPNSLILLVNTASECGLTPQYRGLQKLQETYGARGFTVLGAPCNQFNGQEPGTDQQIANFCALTYAISFPLLAKIDVNGESAHPLYRELTQVEDADGEAGDVAWNFEKFLISPDGDVIERIRPRVEPTSFEMTKLIEANLPR
ncbi:glutathione peroxidase [Corynebacterium testudinoris]|uniref:Glutathione peroxidase n=1 Tax=Corynebacterium testudinoris TaxID=136857 RepID=A0A0G3HEW2_9CORY|nr:glutathione peroxidase [Corynebacterium testudinoris]AKK09662.1 glutathione peroxidase [Corynebacterium testudinoris]MBX8996332.1 glutathione peroxidase [Corynebacterium testudinoris]